jgi:hypothetical protein
LRHARDLRPQPARDDKVLAAWNGLTIAALAEAGVLLDDRYLDAAVRCAELLLDTHLVAGRLRRTSRAGVVGDALAVAEDYGDLAEGLLVLYQACAQQRWLDAARELLDAALVLFVDDEGNVFDTGSDAERLVRRPRDPSDNAAPSGPSALAAALLTYSALTGSLEHRTAAERALQIVGGAGSAQPRFLGWALAAAEAMVDGPVQIALVGADAELVRTAWTARPPGAVVVSGRPDEPGVALLADRPLVEERPTAYVCRGMVCDLPVTGADALTSRLRG